MSRVQHKNQTGTNLHVTKVHASGHTDGTDDVQSATNSQKGLATAVQITKLEGIETSAEVNNISDVNATALTDGGETALHSHADVGGAGKAVVWLLPGSAKLPNSAFARLEKVTRTNGIDNILKFIADGLGTDEYAYWQAPMPGFYQGGNLTITIYSLSEDTNVAHLAKLYFGNRMVVHDGAWDSTFTAIGNVSINPTATARDLLVDTIAWTANLPTAGGLMCMQVYVDASASDYDQGNKDCENLAIKIEED